MAEETSEFLQWDFSEPPEDSNCTRSECPNCLMLGNEKTFTGLFNDTEYNPPPEKMTCKATHVVILLTCPHTGHKYVGKTTTPLDQHMAELISVIYSPEVTYEEESFEGYFVSEEHPFEDVQVQIIAKPLDPSHLDEYHGYWVQRLGTCIDDNPMGLNP